VSSELGLERVGLVVQLVAPAQQVAGQARDRAVESVQLHEQFGHDAVALETAGGDHQVGVEFVQVPADL
jgi:hypothetical protein